MDIQKLNLNPVRAKGDIQTLVCVPNAQWIQTMPECATLEQRKAYWGPCKETGGSCLRNPKLPKGSQRSPFLGKVREGVVNCCKCLLVRSCFLRSGHGQVTRCCQYPSNTCYSLFWQEKARSPGTTVTLQGPILAERRQISAGGSLRAGSPDLAQPSSMREPGTQDPTGSQAPLATQMPRAGAQTAFCTEAAATGLQKWGQVRGSPPPQGLGRDGGSLGEGSGAM